MRKTLVLVCAFIVLATAFVYRSRSSRAVAEVSSSVATTDTAPRTAHVPKARPPVDRGAIAAQEPRRMVANDVPENPKLARAADILREQNLEDKVPVGRFQTGKRVSSSRGNFLSSNVRAMPRDQFDQSQGDLVETRAGYAIFVPKTDDGAANAAAETKNVVVNANNGRLGIVTGTIIAQLKDSRDRFAVSSEFGLKIVAVDESINAVFFAVNASDPEQSVEALQKDSRVSTAELEIVEGTKESL